MLLISSCSKIKASRYVCLSEARASHSQRMWAEVSSCTPNALHNGLSISLSRWRCLLRVLCPVRRPITTLDWVLLRDRNLASKPGQGPEINSRACLWVCPRSHQLVQCWLNNQWLNFVLMTRLETRPGPAQVQEISVQSHPLPAYWRFHSLVLRHVQGPNILCISWMVKWLLSLMHGYNHEDVGAC